MIRIWADFTDLGGGLIPLHYKGSIRDIRRQRVELREGLHIVVYDDTYQSEAIVEKVKGEWLARLIPGTGRDARASPPPPIDENES
jgi:hypothetical protein